MFLMTTFVQLSAMKRVTVEAINNDISYYLDLKAVASVFGESRNLEDFERRLNDYDTQISNLDLNGDGEIDYLRVIETRENSVHLVVIQAILDRNVFQDVATIVVERENNRQSYVQIVGDPYLYGYNYIVEPVYYRTPPIYSWFWSRRYRSWESPFYWGYYPSYYQYRRPIEINIYLSHVHHNINSRNYYRYSDNIRNERAYQSYRSVSRNDYGNRYPDRTFSNRNKEITNRASFDNRSRNSSGRNYQSTDEQGRRVNSVENSRNTNRQATESRTDNSRTNNRVATPNRSSSETGRTERTNVNTENSRNSSTNRPSSERGAENNRVSTPSRNNSEPSRTERTNVNPPTNTETRSSSRPESTVQPRTSTERSVQPSSRSTRSESVKSNEGNSRSNSSSNSRVSSESRGSERSSSSPARERSSSSNNNSESRGNSSRR